MQLFTDPKSMNDLLNTHGLCDISDEMIEKALSTDDEVTIQNVMGLIFIIIIKKILLYLQEWDLRFIGMSIAWSRIFPRGMN